MAMRCFNCVLRERKQPYRLCRLLDRIHPAALIQVDDGMTIEKLPLTYEAGTRVFVAGTLWSNIRRGFLAE